MQKRPRGRPPHDDVLTPAQWRVLHALQHGLSNREIAARMGVSIDAIKYHVGNILAKTGLPSRRKLRLLFITPKDHSAPLSGNAVASSLQPGTRTFTETGMATTQNFGAIGQILRTVRNIETAKNWYELVLELPHLYTFGTLSFFNCNGTRLMLSQNEELNPLESVLYFRVDDIMQASKKLQDKGVEFISAPHKIHEHADGTQEWMAFFKDPEGRTLALMAQLKPV